MFDSLKNSVIAKFAARCAALGTMLSVYANPTEEIHEAVSQKKAIKLFAAGQGRLSAGNGAKSRLEENYLFDTRRFASGALGAAEYLFFGSAVGQPGTNNGFVSPMVMSDVETNMQVASQIPNSLDFVMTQLGISFNANILNSDAALLLEAGALRFSKGGGAYTLFHGPGRMWPGGTGVAGFSGATVTGNSNNGSADIRAVRRLAVARILQAKDTFNYKYVVPRAVSNLDNSTAISLTGDCLMTVWLWGGQQQQIMT